MFWLFVKNKGDSEPLTTLYYEALQDALKDRDDYFSNEVKNRRERARLFSTISVPLGVIILAMTLKKGWPCWEIVLCEIALLACVVIVYAYLESAIFKEARLAGKSHAPGKAS